jgi:cysteine desulfurase
MVYLDNNATTELDPRVLEAMLPALKGEAFGNPASTHSLGVRANRALETARAQVGRIVANQAWKVVFTSGATEANALALFGRTPKGQRDHLVVSAIEHPSVLNCARELEARGCSLTLVAPDRLGGIDPDQMLAAATDRTALMALMLVNNEIGTVEPAIELARKVRRSLPHCHFHIDATQAIGLVSLAGLDGADSVAISGHKLHGPKGIGALLVRAKSMPRPLWFGGGQEAGVRSGTPNVAGAIGLGRAIELALGDWETEAARIASLRDLLLDGIIEAVEGSSVVGDRSRRSPTNAAIAVEGLRGDVVVGALEQRGVIASTGSACHSGKPRPSHVLEAIGHPASAGVVRFGLSRRTTPPEIDQTIAAFKDAVESLR